MALRQSPEICTGELIIQRIRGIYNEKVDGVLKVSRVQG